jgi:hypothetical protein
LYVPLTIGYHNGFASGLSDAEYRSSLGLPARQKVTYKRGSVPQPARSLGKYRGIAGHDLAGVDHISRALLEPRPSAFAAGACLVDSLVRAGVEYRAVRGGPARRHLGLTETQARDLRASAIAIWYAPATLLLAQRSPIPVTSGIVLLVIATRLLCANWTAEAPRRHFLPAFAAAGSLEAAAVSVLMLHPVQAAGFFELGGAILIAIAIGIGLWVARRTPDLPRAVLGLVVTVLLALLTQRLPGGRGWGFDSGEGLGESMTSAAPPAAPAAGPGMPDPSKVSEYGPEATVPGGYPGVVLWPEVKPVPMLIAPALAGGSGFAIAANPLSIPFGGEYWMYRRPFKRPPRNSYFERGSPLSLSFSTTDRAPLAMEARQKLEQPIGIACCRKMRVEIRSAESGRNWLEAILANGNDSQTLGGAEAQLAGSRGAPARETLEFPFPAAPRIQQFDQIRVIFHRPPASSSHSARVAIERFILIP